ncbi:chitinase A1 [Lecanosticta acicola]|uniref:Chitinase A1 n=1 Tax=Lecanosticta acicola TaxID=111012 RepID=A0AAI9EF65_9PEZI|nr:chitinase A1 [Lecanosticta acicola]
MRLKRRIAYYELFAISDRACHVTQPENIPAGALTHVNLAFQLINDDFTITDDCKDVVARVSRLKKTYPGLRVNVAAGGWDFNDPPTQTRFSDLVRSYYNRQKCIIPVSFYLHKYGLDGIDNDWE